MYSWIKNLSQIILKNNIQAFCWCFYQYIYTVHISTFYGYLISHLILFYLYLGLSGGLFPSGFPIKTVCAFLFHTVHATCLAILSNLDFRRLLVFREEWRLLSCTLYLYKYTMVYQSNTTELYYVYYCIRATCFGSYRIIFRPFRDTDPYLAMFKMCSEIPKAYILDITMYKMHMSLCSYCTISILISKTSTNTYEGGYKYIFETCRYRTLDIVLYMYIYLYILNMCISIKH